jgi:enamine deaminase RidA (YjgF/YER057c/UK114 family)
MSGLSRARQGGSYDIDSPQVPHQNHGRCCRRCASRGGRRADDCRAEARKASDLAQWQATRKPPLFSGIVTFGNMVFIAGIGAHFKGDIGEHTKHVLDEIEKRLLSVGSSMDKVLKVNVYLNDLKDYAGMNAAFQGRFGLEPPVRTTIAAAGGIPGDSLVEIDCIAAI